MKSIADKISPRPKSPAIEEPMISINLKTVSDCPRSGTTSPARIEMAEIVSRGVLISPDETAASPTISPAIMLTDPP